MTNLINCFQQLIKATFTIILIAQVIPSLAQSSAFEYGNRSYIRLEVNKPFYEDPDDLGFFSFGNFLNGQVKVTDNIAIAAEIPFAFINFNGSTTYDDFAVGNINIGAHYFNDDGTFKARLAIGLPLLEDRNANSIGLTSDPTERLLHFAPGYLPINAIANYMNQPGDGFTYRLRGGFDLAIPTEDYRDETELYFQIQGMIGYAFNGGMIQAGLSNVAIITEDDLESGERSATSIVFSAEIDRGPVVPGLVVRIPVDDDLQDLLDYSIGLSVGYRFGKQ